MSSQTKLRLLQAHEANVSLRLTTPLSTERGAQDLSADDVPAPLDERMIATAAEALESGQTHYVDVPGIPALRQAIAAYLRERTAADYQQPNVVVTAGIQESRFLTIQMIGEAFDRIAIPAVAHPGVRKAIGVRPMQTDVMAVDAETQLPTVEAVRAAIESGARLLYLESPSRLTGAVYDAETVEVLAALARDSEATVIWDQGLAPWTEKSVSLAAAPEMKDRAVLIGEAFPGTGLSSWFIAYIAAPEGLVPTMQSQKQIMAICTSTPAQYAALEASRLFGESQPRQLERLAAKRRRLADLAKAVGCHVLPGAAATLLALRFSPGEKAPALARLKEAGYAVADGADFGAPDILRLTISHGNMAEQALRALQV
ncbi:MAG: aminotransferase class I/II-fold pyridoxal phosphate-dependent enzyme [Chloroflexi bacterium]|nr:aminotransferase class I/II-fold pyridoxal phosphate-dependent enzyme [Chloroflexota bacterium]